MEMTVQGKQIDVGEALREHVEGKMADIDQKYFNHATDATVTFSREGHGGMFRVHISMHVGKNIMVVTEAVENDPYVAFDAASEKAAKRLRRYKRRLRDHHSRREKTPEEELTKARLYTLAMSQVAEQDNTEEEEDLGAGHDPAVIAETNLQIEKMSVSEAVMRMELADQNVMMFRNAGNDRLNLVYLRKDGHIGWIELDKI